ncbi:hypothetical protein VE01_03671 [Pseudogymnoascus verrucosus]|uniref:Uncharacterized protein n=1 Tax=Pseudogymnoascus verrucosus TaxID=342668 RepID=A0A1B8GRQ4_9PEZI|nr:uncharacterized protein VE01_03671 [Pseudogymnoascus verrucosus]OBT98507.1 hypothetical protein VE01_03671 [Pseudogymnoascus verrucosus]
METSVDENDQEEERRRNYEARLVEQGMASEVATGVANGDYELPLLDQPYDPLYPSGEESIIDAYEGIKEVDILADTQHVLRKRQILDTVVPIADAVAIYNEMYFPSTKAQSGPQATSDGKKGCQDDDGQHYIKPRMASSEIYCPPATISPHLPVHITAEQFRDILIDEDFTRKYFTFNDTATIGDWMPPLYDPSLTADKNIANHLIMRALKWPLCMSGFETPETVAAAIEAQTMVDLSRRLFLWAYKAAADVIGEFVMDLIHQALLVPAMVVLRAAVADLKQPDPVPSRKGLATSVAALVLPVRVSLTKTTSALVVVQDQPRQSPSARIGNTSVLKSKPAPIIPSSSKTSRTLAAATSRPEPVVPSSTKDSVKASPLKTNLSTPGTPSSTKADPKKPRPKPSTATPSLPPPSKAPAVASKLETQLGKTSPVDFRAEKSKYLKPGVLSTSKALSVSSKPQRQIGLASTQKLPQKRHLSSSPSSSSSPIPSRSSSPSLPQPHARTVSKGKETQILPRDMVAATAQRSLPSSPAKVKGEPLQSLGAVDSHVALPKTPTNRVDVVGGLKMKFEEVQSSLQKKKAFEMAPSEQIAALDTILTSLIEVLK